MANILITGASGFIGSNLLAILTLSNHRIIVVKNKSELMLPIKKWPTNIQVCTSDEIESITSDLDIIFHLATHYSKENDLANVKKSIDSNLTFGDTILKLAQKKGANLIFTSSYLQYLADESDSAYVLSKKLFSRLAVAYSEKYNFQLMEIVINDTYGANDKRDKVFNSILQSTKLKKTFVPQKPEFMLNLSFIDDVTEVLVSLIDNPRKGIWQIKSSQDVSVGNLVKIIDFVWNSKFPSEVLTAESDTGNLQNLGIPTILAKTKLIDGIKEVIKREA